MRVSILIVDDDQTLRRLLSKQLNKLGLAADSAANGAEAFERVQQSAYHAILMDVQMPQMDGLEATRLIRAREKELDQKPIPIIAISAGAEREDCFQNGMTDYLQKPVNLAQLRTVLGKYVDFNSLHSRSA